MQQRLRIDKPMTSIDPSVSKVGSPLPWDGIRSNADCYSSGQIKKCLVEMTGSLGDISSVSDLSKSKSSSLSGE